MNRSSSYNVSREQICNFKEITQVLFIIPTLASNIILIQLWLDWQISMYILQIILCENYLVQHKIIVSLYMFHYGPEVFSTIISCHPTCILYVGHSDDFSTSLYTSFPCVPAFYTPSLGLSSPSLPFLLFCSPSYYPSRNIRWGTVIEIF